MSTNFYARLIPTKERKKELHDAIDANDFSLINKLTNELYGSIQMNWMTSNYEGGLIHLGKKSGGWKFLWNPNIFQIRNGHTEWVDNKDGSRSSHWIVEPDTAHYVYPLTKEGIKTFIDREDVEIWDEYDEKQDKEEFWKMAITYKEDDWDSEAYYKEYPDHCHLLCRNEYTDFLESLGYKLSEYKSDFYSDGLRFATNTDFS